MNAILKRLLCALSCSAALAAGAAEPVWFAVAGDPRDPGADTILIDMSSLRARQNVQVMEVRVSRGHERLSRNTGHRFRSYAAKVHIDCARDQALLRNTRFYAAPLWSGEPFATVEFPDPQQVPLALREFDPNPLARIMRAACNPI
ncbi:MAG: hypothetical protein KA795_01400 [Burkholderiaceae bacterium]|nr:hypothetical protein [Burkholderiaceae bacterium]